MTERSWPWDDTFAGDALAMAPYLADDWTIMLDDILGRGGSYGVFLGAGNGLVVTTSPGNTSPCIIDTGAAFVAGQYYRNTAPVSIAIPYAYTAIRYDRIVVRRTWSTKQARLTRLPGIEGAGVPALVQDWGNIYDVPVAIITAMHVYLHGGVNSTYATDDRKDRGWPDLVWRQGGDPTDWNVAGTTNYRALKTRIQCGNKICVWATGLFTVTFPTPFSAVPLVFLTTDCGTSITAYIDTCTANGFTGGFVWHFSNPVTPHAIGAGYNTTSWLAIGPE